MGEIELHALLSAIREQLDRNGLMEAFSPGGQKPVPEPDISEIRLIIEREEKQYLQAVNV